MLFWTSILVGTGCVWFALKVGFYEMLAALFNIVVSIYVAIFLRPTITDAIAATGRTPYGNALAMLVTALISLLVLHAISYTFLTGHVSVAFPKTFDILLAGVMGFLAGLLIWSFAVLLICITPISELDMLKEIGFDCRAEQINVSVITRCCNLVNSAVASPDNSRTTEDMVNSLLEDIESKRRQSKEKQPVAVEPNKPAGLNSTETEAGRGLPYKPLPEGAD